MSRRRRLAIRIAAALILSVLFLAPARARAATVLIVRPATPSPAAAETLSRLHGELLAVGLAVDVAIRPEGATDARAWLRREAHDRALDAALEILDSGPLPAVDVWIFSGPAGDDQITSVAAAPGAENAVEQLAIRAVDFVRSILIESRLGAGRARPPEAAPALARVDQPAAPSARHRLGLALGAAVLSSAGGGDVAVAPAARLEATLGTTVALQLEAAGLGTRPRFTSADGSSATLARQYLLAGVCACGPSPRRLRPTFAVAAGALHTSAEGSATPPASGHDVAQWSLLLQATLGARLTFLEDYELSLDAHAQLAQPYVTVYVGNAAVATVGRPTFVLSLTLGGWR